MSIKKYRYNGEEKFKINDFDTSDKGDFKSREEALEEFVSNLKEINKLQQKLYAARQEGVVFVFQAMDAAGKDGCIRTVFSTLTPHGVKEYCFKAPSAEELSHDYLWRFWSAMPARGHISIFNRSYYEDVLIGKVHKLYENQIVPERMRNIDVIGKRYKEINAFEKYLYNNATRVVKIFLNVSKDEQALRFISRIDTPKKNWKVSSGDIAEREYWDEYQEAFESMVNHTSSKKSPWYVVPADHKWYARLVVSRIVLATLQEMDPQYPDVDNETLEHMHECREKLFNTLSDKDKAKLTKNNDDLIKPTIEEENVNKLMESEENEFVDDLKSIDGEEESDKKHKKKKKHKKSKKNKESKKKSKNSSVKETVQEIMEDVEASTDNAFTDGSDVVVESYLEEEIEKMEEKSQDIETQESDDETSEIEQQTIETNEASTDTLNCDDIPVINELGNDTESQTEI